MSAVIAHEIKNPLSTIRGSAELVAGLLPKESNAGKYIDYILKEVDRLNAMLSDILAFGSQPEINLKQVDLNALIGELMDVMQESDFAKRGIKSDRKFCSPAPQVSADPQRLKQVLINMIGNACRSTENSGKKEVSVRTSRGVDSANIEIEDTGEGISAENMDKIFEPFFTTRSKGTGLGLAVSKTIVEKHGGEIKVKSREGEGTVFTITLPMNRDNKPQMHTG